MSEHKSDPSEDYYAVVPDDELQEYELARLVDNRVAYILVQGLSLSGRVESAIRMGNAMHKTAVISGVTCLALNWTPLPFKYITLPLGLVSTISAVSYALTWQGDPLCKYQIDATGNELAAVAPSGLPVLQPGVTILVRRDDTVRRILHNTIAASCAIACAFRLRKV